MPKLATICAVILTLALAVGFTVSAQTDSTPQADGTPDPCATPLAEMDGTPTGDATAAASPTDGSPVACPTPATPGGEATTATLVMVDIAFEPAELTIAANTDVTIDLPNQGALPHAFEIPDQGIASDEVPGGGSTSVVVNLPPGEYPFICPVPGHADAGMVGTLTVQ